MSCRSCLAGIVVTLLICVETRAFLFRIVRKANVVRRVYRRDENNQAVLRERAVKAEARKIQPK